MFIEILFQILLFKGGVLIYAEHCIYIYTLYNLFSHSSYTFLLILLFIKTTVYCPAHFILLHMLLFFIVIFNFLLHFFHTYFYVYSLVLCCI